MAKVSDSVLRKIYDDADAAGKAAADACVPVPMVVGQADGLSDRFAPGAKLYRVEGGACGFAWINVKPANSPFANYVKRIGVGRKSDYEGGVNIWVSAYGQSMARKEAYANAFAKSVRDAGIDRVYASSRID